MIPKYEHDTSIALVGFGSVGTNIARDLACANTPRLRLLSGIESEMDAFHDILFIIGNPDNSDASDAMKATADRYDETGSLVVTIPLFREPFDIRTVQWYRYHCFFPLHCSESAEPAISSIVNAIIEPLRSPGFAPIEFSDIREILHRRGRAILIESSIEESTRRFDAGWTIVKDILNITPLSPPPAYALLTVYAGRQFSPTELENGTRVLADHLRGATFRFAAPFADTTGSSLKTALILSGFPRSADSLNAQRQQGCDRIEDYREWFEAARKGAIAGDHYTAWDIPVPLAALRHDFVTTTGVTSSVERDHAEHHTLAICRRIAATEISPAAGLSQLLELYHSPWMPVWCGLDAIRIYRAAEGVDQNPEDWFDYGPDGSYESDFDAWIRKLAEEVLTLIEMRVPEHSLVRTIASVCESIYFQNLHGTWPVCECVRESMNLMYRYSYRELFLSNSDYNLAIRHIAETDRQQGEEEERGFECGDGGEF